MANQQTMGEYLVGRVGLRRATGVAAFVVAWGIYSEKVEGPHTLDGYAKYWGQSISKTYKERDVFRMCFPDDKVPDRVWALCRGVYDANADQQRRDGVTFRLMMLPGRWV